MIGGGFFYNYFSTLQGQKVGESFRKNGKFTPTYIFFKNNSPKFSPKKINNQQVAKIPRIFF
jgi:hypothetical protein